METSRKKSPSRGNLQGRKEKQIKNNGKKKSVENFLQIVSNSF